MPRLALQLAILCAPIPVSWLIIQHRIHTDRYTENERHTDRSIDNTDTDKQRLAQRHTQQLTTTDTYTDTYTQGLATEAYTKAYTHQQETENTHRDWAQIKTPRQSDTKPDTK